MPEIIQAIRGMNDILPDEVVYWQHVETIFRRIFQNHCYEEIRFPIVEKTELFKRSIGDVTDIVEKEMYTFLDRNQDSLSLRPEGTACCVRACIEQGLLYNQIQRLWYLGPFFRYERPQKGRYRQFHQCSAESFGLGGPDIDAELILMSHMMLEKLNIKTLVKLEINSLGSLESRLDYRRRLVHYFKKHEKSLDEDSLKRLNSNPLRILDSKNPDLKELIHQAPKLLEHLDPDSLTHFEKLQDYLSHASIPFEINPCLVRGLDYYNKTVFEWKTIHLGAQDTICAGGRYDSLVEQLGGKSTPAIGFSIGMERAILLAKQSHFHEAKHPHVYLITEDDHALREGLKLADYLRNNISGLKLLLHCGGGSLKNQLKKADKSGAIYAVILGERELKTNTVSLKFLREPIPQQTLYEDKLVDYLKLHLSKNKI